ncbi:hypothetical protein BJX61DRAFT_545413, partial [Aspergillus egyptiacus]
MKPSVILSTIAALTATATASALPSKGYHVAQARDVDIASVSDLVFTGPVYPGGPNITLTGTAQSIYEQLRKENPEYNAWAFPEYRERMAAMGITEETQLMTLEGRDLSKRAT